MNRNETLNLNIPEPCQQAWNDMTPNGCGRFCASCQKTVIDFTVMTDAQIIDIFRNSKTIPCGRFFPEQLNRPLQGPAKIRPFPFYQKITAAILALQAFTVASFAQGKKKPATTHHKKSTSGQKQQTVKGRLLDMETNKPVAGCRLQVIAAGLDSFYTTTDATGHFHFILPGPVQQVRLLAADTTAPFIVDETIQLIHQQAGHIIYRYPKHMLPEAEIISQPVSVTTIAEYHTMGVPAPDIEYLLKSLTRKPTFWYRITHPFRKKHR